jgi:hypothetical protein
MVDNTTYLSKEAKAWVKRKDGPDEIIRVVPDLVLNGTGLCYQLYTSFEENPENLGRILFDAQGYWIYDGIELSITEQEQVAGFIINYKEVL